MILATFSLSKISFANKTNIFHYQFHWDIFSLQAPEPNGAFSIQLSSLESQKEIVRAIYWVHKMGSG